MNNHDEQFENFLREFTPRRPRALEVSPPQRFDLRRFAAAAAIVVGCVASTWFAWRSPLPAGTEHTPSLRMANAANQSDARQESLISLTRLAVQYPQRLDAVLDQKSRFVLPRFDQPNSTLRVLAKE